ncbi:MAG: CARDB domain-containing protein [Promethearchaeia archaeon]
MKKKSTKGLLFALMFCFLLGATFLLSLNTLNSNRASTSNLNEAQKPSASATDIQVAILNSDEGDTYSGWDGGNDNPYDRVQTVLDDRGYSTTIITNDDITSGSSLYNMGIDVLVLPDNGPTDTAAAGIGDWCRDYDGHIVSLDSSVVVLFYEGLITGEIHNTNYQYDLWDYSATTEGNVTNNAHPIMESYSLYEQITGTSGNSQFIKSEMESSLGTEAQYFHPLVEHPGQPDYIQAAAFDFPEQGRFVQIWDQYPEDDTHDTENLFINAVDWVYNGGSSARPDLEVSFTTAPSEGEAYSTVTYTAKVKNIGSDTASNINFYLDIEGSTETSHLEFDLAPEESYSLSIEYTLPSSGSILIEAYSDVVTGETIINNNQVSTSTSIVDDPAPTLSYDSSFTYYKDSTGNVVNITAQDEDPEDYRYRIDGDTWSSYYTWTNEQDIEINIDGLSEGYHDLEVQIYDIYGTYSTANVEINVEQATDTAAPSIDQPEDITVSEGYTEQAIIWTVSDEYPSTYSINCNGTAVISNDSWSNGEITYNITDGKATGTYIYEITVEDESGNTASDTVEFTVTEEPAIENDENNDDDSDENSDNPQLEGLSGDMGVVALLALLATMGIIYLAYKKL